MSAVSDAAKSNTRQMENTKKAQTKELNSLERNHQNVKDDIKKNHANDLVNVHDNNQRQVLAATEKKEKVLEELRTNQQQTEQVTEKELESLKVGIKKDREAQISRLSSERQRIQEGHNESLEEMNQTFNEKTRDAHTTGTRELDRMNQTKNQEFTVVKGQQTKKINDQTQNFNTRFKFDAENYKGIKDTQDAQFKRERATTNLSQQRNIAKMGDEHKFQIDKKDKLFKQSLKAQEQAELKKYEDTMKVHSENFKSLDERHKKVVSQVKTDMTDQISTMVKRSDDPFYKFSDLKPILSTFPDRVEVRVEVPEHSKQDLSVTLNQKEVVVSLNRRYADTNKSVLGSSKVSKVESFTSRINTDAILDMKSLKSTYENGTMTYVIKKA